MAAETTDGIAVTVLLFGHYRDRIADKSGRLDVILAQPATIADLAARLAVDNSRLDDLLAKTRVALGGEFVSADAVLLNGDEVAFLPPMSGG